MNVELGRFVTVADKFDKKPWLAKWNMTKFEEPAH
jgi:hypothetical protein